MLAQVNIDMGATGWLPPDVCKLAGREREIATIIYSVGGCTAKDIEARLSAKLTNSAVRSMLVRLTRKNILERHLGGRGRGREYVYLPVITPCHVKRHVLVQLSEQYFDGSVIAVALAALDVAGTQIRPGDAADQDRTGRYNPDEDSPSRLVA